MSSSVSPSSMQVDSALNPDLGHTVERERDELKETLKPRSNEIKRRDLVPWFKKIKLISFFFNKY